MRVSEANKYQRIRDGQPTTMDDPERGVWYSAGCGYWTDDWSQLKTAFIPCCPMCRCPGMQTTWEDWIGGAKKHEENGHPWYRKWLLEIKEHCYGRNFDFTAAYESWCKEKGIQPLTGDTP